MRLIADDPFIQTRELLEKAELTCCAGTLLAWLKKAGVAHKTAIRSCTIGNADVARLPTSGDRDATLLLAHDSDAK